MQGKLQESYFRTIGVVVCSGESLSEANILPLA